VEDFVSQVSGVSALAEPARRALYLYVATQQEPVSRDAAAEAVGLPRHTAKFHLDKLVEEGLLDTEFRRLSGRRGPGAGRPTKLYRRSARQLAITLPQRRYDLAGQILAEGVDAALRDEVPVLDAVRDAATVTGRRLGADARHRCASAAPTAHDLADALSEHGYEPRQHGAVTVLGNCPFHALARDHTELVCGMNLSLVTAFLEELGCSRLQARLDPAPDRCCVTVAEATSA